MPEVAGEVRRVVEATGGRRGEREVGTEGGGVEGRGGKGAGGVGRGRGRWGKLDCRGEGEGERDS